MNWKLLVTKSARKNLASLPSGDQVRIERSLDALESNPFSGDIKRLKPSGWRRRVGNHRIFYDLDVGAASYCCDGHPTADVHNVLI